MYNRDQGGGRRLLLLQTTYAKNAKDDDEDDGIPYLLRFVLRMMMLSLNVILSLSREISFGGRDGCICSLMQC